VLRYPPAKGRGKHYPTINSTPVNGVASQSTIAHLASILMRQGFVPTQARQMSGCGCDLNRSTQHFILNGKMGCMLMSQRYRRGFTAAEKTELWDCWQRGESLKAIGRAYGKPSSSIYFQLAPHGGIRPAPRRRSRLALTLSEREEISRGIVAQQSIRSMASLLGRSPSTVSREVRRNGGYDQYRAALADERTWARARRPKRCKLAMSPRLRRAVARKLRLNWSPEQIAGWLKRAHPGDESYHVSHETIYRSLFVQARGVLKKELLQHLRSKRTIRRSKQANQKGDARGQIKDIISISERPASVEDRAVPGHWEGDLLSGSKNSHIATLVERHTRYVMLAKVTNKETQTVVSALIKQAKKLPNELYKSLTWDRGKEFADHRRFTLATDIDVYFCDPQSPWQRGSNENTNGLLRQYFPKGTDLSVHSQAHLNKVARQLNERPRKTLEFETPTERFNACVASTG
jgi:IS30 family transposase